MSKKQNTHTRNTNAKQKNSKWDIFNFARSGLMACAIVRQTGLNKSTVSAHLKDLVNKDLLVKEGYFYYPTFEGEKINFIDFCSLFNSRRVVRYDLGESRDEFRNHNMWFNCKILKKPHRIPTNSKKIDWSKNNPYYIIKFDIGCVYVHTNHIKINIYDFTSESQGEAVIEESRRLNRIYNLVEREGYDLDKYANPTKSHIALMKTAFIEFFKCDGAFTLVPADDGGEPRLYIDWSHGVGELESGNVKTARPDIQKTADFLRGLINRDKSDFWEKFEEFENIIQIIKNGRITNKNTKF